MWNLSRCGDLVETDVCHGSDVHGILSGGKTPHEPSRTSNCRCVFLAGVRVRVSEIASICLSNVKRIRSCQSALVEHVRVDIVSLACDCQRIYSTLDINVEVVDFVGHIAWPWRRVDCKRECMRSDVGRQSNGRMRHDDFVRTCWVPADPAQSRSKNSCVRTDDCWVVGLDVGDDVLGLAGWAG